jgi:hypothetical protein
MGRGRAKAKQTKVARELKYHSPDMDLDRLRSDLGAGDWGGPSGPADDSDVAVDDPYTDAIDGDERPPRLR